MKIEQFTRGLVDGWPTEVRRGGGSVVVNADGSVSVTGPTTVTGDLTVTGSINASAAGIILEDDEELFFGTNTDYWFQYRAAGTAFELRSTDVDGAGADGIVWKVEDGTDDVDFTGDITAVNLTGALIGNADTATVLATPRDIGGVSFDGSAAIVPQTIQVVDSTEVASSVAIFDAATGNLQPKTDAGLTYDAATGILSATGFSGPLTGAVTGNADTATLAATVTVVDSTNATSSIAMFDEATGSLAIKTDGGLTYDATTGILSATGFAGPLTGAVTGNADTATLAALASTVTVVDSTNATSSIAMFDEATGSLAVKTDGGLTYDATTGILTATGFAGPLTGAVTGNADTATVLANPRDINGVAFDGSTSITITAAAGTLTGTTLNGTVVSSSLTSLGTIGSLVATTADIDGGTFDGIVGGTTPADGSFTTLGASSLITASAGVLYGTTVTLTEGSPNVLELASGDDFYIVSGAMGIGAVPSANADLLLEAGRLMLKESATPTADSGYGKVYTKTDDKLYFQDGAGVEHTFSVADYAAIRFDDNSSAETIDLTDLYHLVTRFATNGLDEVSTSDQANNRLTIGASRDYKVALSGSAESAGAAKTFVFDVFEISQTTANITAITQATPGVVTAAGHGFSNGDLCKITGVVGMTEVNDKIYRVAGVSGADFSLQDDEGVSIATGGFGAWSSGGTVALAIKTFAHSDRTFSNASGFGSFSSHWFYAATLGDALEFAIKNKSDATDLTFEHLNLTVKAL